MANLLGQNIGTNYKGILNLNTLNGNLSGTLQAVTDGDGNASALQLSTSLSRISANLTIGGSTTASARLHVMGDGTNPIARFENPSATDFITINNSAAIRAETTDTNAEILRLQRNNSYFLSYAPVGLFRIQTLSGGAPNGVNNTKWIYFANRIDSASTASQAGLMIDTTIACATGSHSPRVFEVGYSINNAASQTGTATGIFLNATETALNGMTHNLMDLQVGGVSQFSVSRTGLTNSVGGFQSVSGNNRFANLIINGGAILQTTNGGGSAAIELTSTGTRLLYILNLQFGGNTNAFPMLKRNGAALEVRLADDSGFADLGGKEVSASVGFFAPNSTEIRGTYMRGRASTFINFSDGTPGMLIDSASGTTASASAILQADSTTKGFLLPRMTEAQRDAITTPAEGLLIYNTTTQKLNIYNTSWVAVH